MQTLHGLFLLSRIRAPLEGTVGALLMPQIRAVEDKDRLIVSRTTGGPVERGTGAWKLHLRYCRKP